MKDTRVVITGLGAVTPLGNDVQSFWSGLIEGRSGVDLISRFDTTEHDTKFAAELKGFDPLTFIDKKDARKMDMFTQFGVAAAKMALEDSGLDLGKEDLNRIGVIAGSGIGGMWSFEEQHKKLLERGPSRVSPFFIPMMIIDIVAGYISIIFGLKGPNYSTVSACTTASHAIGDAFALIQRGDADVMVTGGSEAAICPIGMAGFNSMKALSTRNDDFKTASRPFDKDRDGFVMGEGAGIVVLEEMEHATKRGARIYGELVGMGYTADAYHLTAPVPGGEGAARAMEVAVRDAGLEKEAIGYINAHGTSTPYNDKNESAAIKTVFGDHAHVMAVSSTKSMTGHLLGASGAIEFIATTLAVRESIIPPTINYQTPDPDCDLNYVPNQAVKRNIEAAISNTFGFGGHNVSLVVKKLT